MRLGLKEWVAQLTKRLLSAYLEGIAESNLQGSLSRAVGKVDIDHVRLQQALLEEQHLQLLSSDVSVAVQIPWRNLASEHVVITVSDVWMEVCAKPEDEAQALKSWRTRRARSVQAQVAAGILEAKQKAQGEKAGGGWGQAVGKRVAHALVSRLQVHVERLHVRAWLEGSPPLDVRCERLALDDMETDTRSSLASPAPPEAMMHSASLHKGLELDCFSVKIAAVPPAEAALQQLHETRLLFTAAQRRVESAPTYAKHRREELLDIKKQLQSDVVLCGGDDAGEPSQPGQIAIWESIIGPISLEARLWHSTDAGLLWLRAELVTRESSPMLSISPSASRWARQAADWFVEASAAPPALRAGVEEAFTEMYSTSERPANGKLALEYAALLSARQRKESHDASRLAEIEDVAPLDLLVSVQLSAELQRASGQMEPVASSDAAPGEDASNGTATNARWFGGVRRWLPGGGSAEGGGSEDIKDVVADLMNDATQEGVLSEELEEPRRVELMLEIPDCTIFCLRPSASNPGAAFMINSGLEVQAAVKTTGPSLELPSYLHCPWEADVSTNVTSLAVLLGDDALMFAHSETMSFANPEEEESLPPRASQLQQRPETSQCPRQSQRLSQAAETFFSTKQDFSTPRSSAASVISSVSLARQSAGLARQSAVVLNAACKHKGGVAPAASQAQGARWSLFVRLNQEPFQLSLSPWSVRSVAEILAAVVHSASDDTKPFSKQPAQPEEAVTNLKYGPELSAAASEKSVEQTPSGSAASTSGEDVDLDIDFDANFEAPVLKWSVPNGHVTLALGSFLLRTCGNPPPAERPPELQRCAWRNFACYCQLANTSLAVKAQGIENRIYEPSTICVRSWRQPDAESANLSSAAPPGSWQVLLESELVRWTVFPSALEVVGQLLPCVKYSLEPLVHVLVGSLENKAPATGTADANLDEEGQDEGTSTRWSSPGPSSDPKPSGGQQAPGWSLAEHLAGLRRGPVQLSARLKLQRCELIVKPGLEDISYASLPTSLLIEDMQATYLARETVSDLSAKQARIELSYGSVPLLSCSKGGSLSVQTAGSCVAVTLQSSLFAVDWQQQQAHSILLMALALSNNYTGGQIQAEACLAESQKESEAPAASSLDEDLTIVQQHVGKKIWEEVQKKRKSVTLRQQRLSSNFSGFDLISARSSVASCVSEDEEEPAPPQDTQPAAPPPRTRKSMLRNYKAGTAKNEKLTLPEVTGECFMEVVFQCDGIRACFLECEPLTVASFLDQTPHVPSSAPTPVLQCTLTGIHSRLQVFHTGDSASRISLKAAEVVLKRRQILLPRKEGELFQLESVTLAAKQESTILASWAQLCILYRQCDIDFIQDFVQQSLVSTFRDVAATAERQAPAGAQPQPKQAAPSEAPRSQAKTRFHLDIGAPRLFVPTDRTTWSTAGKFALQGRQLLPDVASGEPWLPARPGEGFLLFDFGHIAVQSKGEEGNAGELNLMLQGAHILGADPHNVHEPREMLRPVFWNCVLRTDAGVEFRAMDETVHEGKPAGRLSMTRSQLTLMLDVFAENIGYAGRSGLRGPPKESPTPAASGSVASFRESMPPAAAAELPASFSGQSGASSRSSAASEGTSQEAKAGGGGFRFSWTWPGELDIDLLFTESAPLVRLRMESGQLLINNTDSSSQYVLECEGLSMLDLRLGSKNVNRKLLECGRPAHGGPCYKLVTDNVAGEDGRTTLTFAQPVLLLLPQLLTDCGTWGASAWQQCTFVADAPPPQQANSVADETKTHVEVVFDEGAVRIAEKWSETTEYLELLGTLRLHVITSSEGIRFESFHCKGGSMRLRSGLRCVQSTILPSLEWEMQGRQVGQVIPGENIRHTQLRLTKVVMHPLVFRMSEVDQRSLSAAFAELGTMDAPTAEPEEELKERDPLAYLFQNWFTFTLDSMTFEGVQVHILDQAGSTVLPGLLAQIRCRDLSGGIQNKPGYAPMVNFETPEFALGLLAHHPRRGVWDPVIPECHWELKHHTQRADGGGPRDIKVQNVAKASGPVSILLSPSSVHLIARTCRAREFDMRYGNLLLGVNISGLDCCVESDGGGRCLLRAEGRLQPLDELLAGVDTSHGKPQFTVRLDGHDGAAECSVPMDQEACIPWDVGSEGLLVCRVVMLHPPHRILMVSSTVCLYNHCSIDLDVRFLHPDPDSGSATVPLHPVPAFRSIHAGFLEADESQFGAGGGVAGRRPLPPPESAAGPPTGSGPEGDLRLRAGWILAAPAPACSSTASGACDAFFQLRPALEARSSECYGWSEVLRPCHTESGVTVSCQQAALPVSVLGSFIGHSFASFSASNASAGTAELQGPAPDSLSRHWLHLQAGTSRASAGGSFCSIKVQAPLTVMNACPCDVLCWVNPLVTHSQLGVKTEYCGGDLVVLDGRGSEFRVPLCGEAKIFPMQLDNKGFFYWTCDGQRRRTKPNWPNTNCVVAEFGADGKVNWRCVEVFVVESQASPVKIEKQGEVPMFGVLCEEATISFALESHGERTGWSLPVRVGSSPHGWDPTGKGPSYRPAQEVIELPHGQVPVRLNVHRRGRELVINAFCWFVNCTGLDVRLMQPKLSSSHGAMCPVPSFGERVAFLPTVRNEAGDLVANLSLHDRVFSVRVPDIGGSVPVDLSLMHQCCLRTEAVTLSRGLGNVPCRLVSLIPQILLFNKADCKIGFRQAYAGPRISAVWVESGKSGTFWWASETPPHRVEVIANLPGGQTACSPSFEIVQDMIGAYPLVLSDGRGGRCLLCIRIDQDATVFSVTVCGSTACHMLTNHHPGLLLRVKPDQVDSRERMDEALFHFNAPCGEQVPFAGCRPFQSKRRVRLILESTADPEEKAEMLVDLDRTSTIRFLPPARKTRLARLSAFVDPSNIRKADWEAKIEKPVRTPADRLPRAGGIETSSNTLRMPVFLKVELCGRVAIVTASSTVLSVEEARQHTYNELSFKSLSVALISEDMRPVQTGSGNSVLSVVPRPTQSASSSPASGARRTTKFGLSGRVEAFTVHLKGLTLKMAQQPSRERKVDFEVLDVQVAMRHPYEDVVLANVTTPFIKTYHRNDDVAMLDNHVSDAQVSLGQMEVTITEEAVLQLARLATDLMPDSPGLSLETVLARAGKPYHHSCTDPFHATSKLVLRKLEVSRIVVQIWCTIYLGSRYVPNWVRAAVQLVSWGTSTLEFKGASIKLGKQSLCGEDQPGVGSPAAVFAQVSSHYLPYLAARWRALLKDSNVFFGGFLSRFKWNPRQRKADKPWAPVAVIMGDGEVSIRDMRPSTQLA